MRGRRFYFRGSSLFCCVERNLVDSQQSLNHNLVMPFQAFSRSLASDSSRTSWSFVIFDKVVSRCQFQPSGLGQLENWRFKYSWRSLCAVSDVAEPKVKFCEKPLVERTSLKSALSTALQNYFITSKYVPASEAALMVKNAPKFMKKLLVRAKEEKSLTLKSQAVDPDHDGALNFQARVDAWVAKQNVDEIEVFFETLGLGDKSVLEYIVASENPKLVGEEGLLVNTKLLQGLGIPRKRLWRLYDRDRKLLKCTHTDFCASIRVLDNLGVQRKALPTLVQACPSVLRIDVEETMKDVLRYMEDLGIEKNFVGRLLQYNPQEVLGARHTHFGEKMQYLLDCGLSKDRVIRMLRDFPQLLILSLEVNVKPNIEFLCSLGLRKEQVGNIIVRSPQLLSYSVKKNLLPKIAYLESLGVERGNVAPILVKFPGIFGHSIEESMTPKVKFLESLGVERKNVGKIITLFPAIIGYSIEDNLIPKMKYFESIGMERASFGRVVTRSPSILGLSVEQNLKPKVAFFEANGVKEKDIARLFTSHPSVVGRAIDGSLASKLTFLASLGLEPKSDAMAKALVACAAQSVTSLEMKCNNLLEIGFPQKALLNIVIQQPTLLHLCEAHLKCKVKFYTEEVGLAVEELPPSLLSYSLENRIKPRYKWMTLLQSSGLLSRKIPISTVMSICEKSFLKKFVEPYPQMVAQYSGTWSLPTL